MIPKIIHQTWKTKELSRRTHSYVKTWKKMNPDYEYRLYDDQECYDFVKECYPEYLKTYESLIKPVEKADFFRYLIVYHYGGIYADLDTSCEKPMDQLILSDDEAIIGLEANITVEEAEEYSVARPLCYAQWVFLAEPKHPVFKNVLDRICLHAGQNLRTIDKTGPGVWTDAVLDTEDTSKIRFLSIDYFGAGQAHSKARLSDPKKIFVLHHFFASWTKKPRRDCAYRYCRRKIMKKIYRARGEGTFLKRWFKKLGC